MKKLWALGIASLFILSVLGQPKFEAHFIEQRGTGLGQTYSIDMDNDGDLDVGVGSAWHKEKNIWYYENIDGTWTYHLIGQGDSDVGGDAYDLTGDGFPEVWSGTKLFVNNKNGTFSEHIIGGMRNHDALFADIDGDGKMDGVANSDLYGLVWYKIPDDPTQTWEENMIAPIIDFKIHGGIAPGGVVDIDGDGDLDVATAKCWYENADGKGTKWNQWITFIELGEDHKYGIAVRTVGADLDGDGDMDIVQSECDNPDSRVGWYENNGCGHFTFHMIKAPGGQVDLHGLAVADFDGDSDLEIVAGGGPLGMVTNVYLFDKEGSSYKEYVIAENAPGHELVTGDFDQDGDLDIYGKHWADGTDIIGPGSHFWYENKTIQSPDPEWVSLFDGETLDGWIQTGGQQEYYVENGCIVGEAVQGVSDNAFLVHESTFGDFHLKFDVLLEDAGLNSGVQFRSYVAQQYTELWLRGTGGAYNPKKHETGRMYGYQVEISGIEASGYIWDEARRDKVPEWWGTDNGSFIVGQWNHYEIICDGPIITTYVNGVRRLTANDGLTLEGLIGLQVHGNTAGGLRVLWKNLLIKGDAGEPDPPDPPIDPPEGEELIYAWGFNNDGEPYAGGVSLNTSGATKYYQQPAPEGSHYAFGEWGGIWDSEQDVTIPTTGYSVEFLVKPKPSSETQETPKTVFEIGDMTMLIVMGSIVDGDGNRQTNTGKVAMPVMDYTQTDPERGFESYGNVIIANQWNHVVMTRKDGDCDPEQDWDIIINGREVSVMEYSKTAYEWDNTAPIRVARMYSGKYPMWDGIDDLRIYNYQMSVQEAIDRYNSYGL